MVPFLLEVGLVVGLVLLLLCLVLLFGAFAALLGAFATLLLCFYRARALRVVDTPTFCTMCQICFIKGEECRGAIPMARRWFRPWGNELGNEAWVCDLCIFSLLKAKPVGCVARVWVRVRSGVLEWLADSSTIGWRLADGLLMLTIPSSVVTGANIYVNTISKRTNGETSTRTSSMTPPPAPRTRERAKSPAAKPTHVGDSKKNK
jgi:hypothetical protein